MAKIIIDQETCIGCGACTAVSSDLFEISETGKAQPKKTEDLTEEETSQAKEGLEVCPVQAIKVE